MFLVLSHWGFGRKSVSLYDLFGYQLGKTWYYTKWETGLRASLSLLASSAAVWTNPESIVHWGAALSSLTSFCHLYELCCASDKNMSYVSIIYSPCSYCILKHWLHLFFPLSLMVSMLLHSWHFRLTPFEPVTARKVIILIILCVFLVTQKHWEESKVFPRLCTCTGAWCLPSKFENIFKLLTFTLGS